MASQTKTFECKYCDISGFNRKQYFKHSRTQEHKNMLQIAIQDAKIRTQLKVNKLGSSTRLKFTKDGKYVNELTSEWLDIKDQK